MVNLSASYEKTLNLLDAGNRLAAQEEFRTRFVPTAKKVFSEAAQTYPTRFSKATDWCTWVKDLYTMSVMSEMTLSGSDLDNARKELAALRNHVYKLHKDTDTQKVNDLIHAFRLATAKDPPSPDELKALRQAIEKAPPSAKAGAEADAFAKARTEWAARIDPILKDGAIDAAKLKSLRAATDSFYRAFGVQFE